MDIMALLKKRYEDEEKRLESDRAREIDLGRDSFIAGLGRIAEDAGNNALKFRSLGGQSMDVRPSNRAAEDYRMARADEKELRAANKSSGRDLLDRLQRLKEKEDTDKKYAKEWEYKLERDRESDKLAREKLDFQKEEIKNKYDKESRKVDRESALYKSGYETNKKALDKAQTTLGALEAFKDKVDAMEKLANSTNSRDVEDAYALGNQMIKQLLNAEGGTGEAVGAEEAKRLGEELERNFSNIIKHGKLRDADAFIRKVRAVISSAGKSQKSIYDKAYQRLESEDFQPYEAKFLEEKREEKKPDKPKVGDRFIDPETGIEMIYVEED